QQVGDVFFIPAGAATAHPDEILMQPRWRKLQAGFRSEGALLLLFLSATALGKLSAVPDGVLALAPEGFTLEGAGAEGVRAALDRGATLIGTVRERWTPPPESVRPAMEARASGPRILMGRTRRVGAGRAARRPVLVVAGLTVGVAGGWALLARSAEAPAPAVASPHPPAPARPAVVIAAPRADSAAWTVQLAAYGTLPKALAYADRLSRAGVEAFVTPIALDATGAIWYRVLTGGYLTRDSAVAGRAALWRRRLAP